MNKPETSLGCFSVVFPWSLFPLGVWACVTSSYNSVWPVAGSCQSPAFACIALAFSVNWVILRPPNPSTQIWSPLPHTTVIY